MPKDLNVIFIFYYITTLKNVFMDNLYLFYVILATYSTWYDMMSLNYCNTGEQVLKETKSKKINLTQT